MEKKEHRLRHVKLHKMLDELIADYIRHTDKRLSNSTLMELIEWSFEQTKNPKD